MKQMSIRLVSNLSTYIELSASKLTTEMENTQQLSAIRTQTEMPWESHKAPWECTTDSLSLTSLGCQLLGPLSDLWKYCSER